MTTYEELLKLYELAPQRNIHDDLRFAIENGFIFSEPGKLLIGWRVDGDNGVSGWYVFAAIGGGDLAWFFRKMPYYLPYVGWGREAKGRRILKWHETNKVAAKLGITL